MIGGARSIAAWPSWSSDPEQRARHLALRRERPVGRRRRRARGRRPRSRPGVARRRRPPSWPSSPSRSRRPPTRSSAAVAVLLAAGYHYASGDVERSRAILEPLVEQLPPGARARGGAATARRGLVGRFRAVGAAPRAGVPRGRGRSSAAGRDRRAPGLDRVPSPRARRRGRRWRAARRRSWRSAATASCSPSSWRSAAWRSSARRASRRGCSSVRSSSRSRSGRFRRTRRRRSSRGCG